MRRYGWIRDSRDPRDEAFRFVPKLARPEPLPKHLSLREFSPPIYDQGSLGSCTGNAFARAYDICRRFQDEPFLNPSRLFAYWLGRMLEGTTSVDSGAQIRDVIKAGARYGVCPENIWPYDVTRFAEYPPQAVFAAARKDRLISYQPVTQDIDHIRAALSDNIPIVFGITVYESFESEAVASSGVVPMPGAGESPLGGHAIVAVGYDDDIERIEIANSWGSNWGDAGYGLLPYQYVVNSNLASDLWGIRLVAENQPTT